jgi:hypothetical protein
LIGDKEKSKPLKEVTTMRLKEFLDLPGGKAALFAKKNDINESLLSMILSGKRKPSLDVAKKILDGCYGIVQLEDLFESNGPNGSAE